MLLQAKKEFEICGDLRPDDVFFYYTTTLVINSPTQESHDADNHPGGG